MRGHDELAGLAATFNAMLDRLERTMSSQRRFLDDAGHELRTPITIIRGHLELLEDDPEEREATRALLLDELDRMGRMVNELILLAKAERPDFLQTAAGRRGAADRRAADEGERAGAARLAGRQRGRRHRRRRSPAAHARR